jgi:hypothetical protein
MDGAAPTLSSCDVPVLTLPMTYRRILDPAENDVDLFEDFLRSRGRHQPSTAPVEQLHAQRLLRVLHQATDPRRRYVEELRRTGQGAGHHNRANDLDLAHGQHWATNWRALESSSLC